MDLFSRIFAWLSNHEAGISAVAAIIVIGGVVFAGFRWLLNRRSQPVTTTAPEEDPLLALPTGPVVAVLPFEPLDEALSVMERWLDNMQANQSLSVVEAKPDDALDRCYSDTGKIIAEGSGIWDGEWNEKAGGACLKRFPPYSNPRLIAGDDYAGDIFKCHLRTIDHAIANGVYAPVDAAPYRAELQRVFPAGVCDYSLGDAARPDDLL